MRKIMAAGNWKMNGSQQMTDQLLAAIKAGIADGCEADVLVCPSFPYLAQAAMLLKGTPVLLGGQNICTEKSGAYTGEVSGAMLVELGCSHVLVGHSERRALYGETSEIVAHKFAAALSVGLIPVLCVGETLEEREADRTEQVVGAQLQAVVDHCGVDSLSKAILAYEPVWAIGTGKTASPEQAQSVHAYLRRTVADLNGTIGDSLRILYGGSVNGGNAAQLFGMPDVDGGLVGGASLKSDQFLEICAAA